MELALLPIGEVSKAIATWMKTSGTGKKCGGCGKPFNLARKRRSVVRITHIGDAGLMLNTWLLCRSCNLEAKHNDRNVELKLKHEATRYYDELRRQVAI